MVDKGTIQGTFWGIKCSWYLNDSFPVFLNYGLAQVNRSEETYSQYGSILNAKK